VEELIKVIQTDEKNGFMGNMDNSKTGWMKLTEEKENLTEFKEEIVLKQINLGKQKDSKRKYIGEEESST